MQQVEADSRGADPQGAVELAEGAGGVRSVQRAFQLLHCLTPERPTATLTEFAQGTGLATSTVQRLINTMEVDAVLRRLPGGHYTFGSVLLQIAVIALGSFEPHRLVEPHLDRLSDRTGETANFAVLNEDGDVLYLRQSLSRQALRHASWLGRAIPARGTAIGGALTGQADGEGLVSTRDTYEPNVTAIAAPVYGRTADGSNAIVGAISVTGPTFRIDDETLAAYRALVAAEARELTTSLGGRWLDRPSAPGEDAA